MKMRYLLPAGLLALGLAAPASAQDHYVVEMKVKYDCLGCAGIQTATVMGFVTGTVNGAYVHHKKFGGTFQAIPGAQVPVTCALTVTANGTLSGAVSGPATIQWAPVEGPMTVSFGDGDLWVGAAVAPHPDCAGKTVAKFVGLGGLTL